jgi:hypothetical protein
MAENLWDRLYNTNFARNSAVAVVWVNATKAQVHGNRIVTFP